MNAFKTLAVTALFATVALAALGGDVSQPTSESAFSCMIENNNWDFVVVRSYLNYGAVDPNAVDTLSNAQDAGLPGVDVYHFPCVSQGANAQISADLNNLWDGFKKYLAKRNLTSMPVNKKTGKKNAEGLFYRMWLDIETNPDSSCAWSSDQNTNCNFISDLISAVQNNGVPVGVYASNYMWSTIAGDSCTVGDDVALWYANYDGEPNFNDFSPFGGWSSPFMKQYYDSVSNSCGVNADADYY